MFTSAALLLLANAATQVAGQFTNKSAAFNLIVRSVANRTLDGSSIVPCHEGAATEGLCFGPYLDIASTRTPYYNINTTTNTQGVDYDIGVQGILTYTLPTSGAVSSIAEPLVFQYSPTSNVAHLQFVPGSNGVVASGTPVAFNSTGYLNVQNYVDDTVVPISTQITASYQRWYACTTFSNGYTYQTLNWVVGDKEPENPTCQPVIVQQLYIYPTIY